MAVDKSTITATKMVPLRLAQNIIMGCDTAIGTDGVRTWLKGVEIIHENPTFELEDVIAALKVWGAPENALILVDFEAAYNFLMVWFFQGITWEDLRTLILSENLETWRGETTQEETKEFPWVDAYQVDPTKTPITEPLGIGIHVTVDLICKGEGVRHQFIAPEFSVNTVPDEIDRLNMALRQEEVDVWVR